MRVEYGLHEGGPSVDLVLQVDLRSDREEHGGHVGVPAHGGYHQGGGATAGGGGVSAVHVDRLPREVVGSPLHVPQTDAREEVRLGASRFAAHGLLLVGSARV